MAAIGEKEEEERGGISCASVFLKVDDCSDLFFLQLSAQVFKSVHLLV